LGRRHLPHDRRHELPIRRRAGADAAPGHRCPRRRAATVVVEVGYNDPAGMFLAEVNRAMSTLIAAGARHVLWLTMRESRDPYPTLNALLAKAAARWPQLVLVDWTAASETHPSWFQTGRCAPGRPRAVWRWRTLRTLRSCRSSTRSGAHDAAAIAGGAVYVVRLHALGGTPRTAGASRAGRPPRGFHLLANGTLITATAPGAQATVMVSVSDADGTTANLQILEG